jgi:hypothetical protein
MIALPALSERQWSSLAFLLLAIAACGGRTSRISGATAGTAVGTASGAASGTVSAATSGANLVGTSGAASGADSGAAATGSLGGTSGIVTSGSGSAGGTSTGAAGVVPVGDGGPDSGTVVALGPIPSAGCGKPWAGMTGVWVAQPTGCPICSTAAGNSCPTCCQPLPGFDNQGTSACQAIPPGSTVPATATSGSPEYRGWWVYVPTGYDPSKPYTVIYNGAGADDPNWFHAGADGLGYWNVDSGQAILVGLDYDTYTWNPGSYDNENPNSNDFIFMPWLMTEIEDTFCVDTTREWMSGYAEGATLAQQFDCAFPGKLRGEVMVAGWEPGSQTDPYTEVTPKPALPTCHSAPTAAFFVHDIDDTDNPYNSILPGCSRILQQNGCSNTTCDPFDTTLTTPYPVPAGVNLATSNGTCVKFSGCPDEYPVVFCTTNYPPDHHSNDQNMGIATLFWEFIGGSPPARPCPTGQGNQNGICAPCPIGETACSGFCVNEETDSNNCGGCGTACPLAGASCQGGVCGSCPVGETPCASEPSRPSPGGTCVNEQTDPNNCGGCTKTCPRGLVCQGGTCACPAGQTMSNGMCCPSGQTGCTGTCVNEQIDPNNCGGCENECAPDGSAPLCVGGVCTPN